MTHVRYVAAAALFASACASAPPAPSRATVLPPPSFEQKMAWILRLEDQRVLRDPAQAVEPTPLAAPGQKTAVIVPPPPPPDLLRLLRDEEARLRRRAALAVGRVGLADGVDPLIERLSDEEAEVREMAAFALGILGDGRARAPLVAALADPSPLVQGSAAEALGLIGDPASADAVGKMVAAAFATFSGAAQPPGEADDGRRDTVTSACRLGIFAIVRLKAYPQLASAVLDDRGEPRLAWWPIAYALGRLEDKRALPALLTLVRDSHPYTRSFAVKGLGALKDSSAMPALLPLIANGDRAIRIEAIRAVGRIGDRSAAAPLLQIIRDGKADPQIRLEAVTAIGGIHATQAADVADAAGIAGIAGIVDTLLDVLADPSPPIRAAALRSTAALDAETFVTVLSGLDPDANWSVRAALAATLGTLRPESVLARLRTMVRDADQRVLPSVLGAFVTLKAPDAATILLESLKADDPVVRAAAADGLGILKIENAAGPLADAYRAGQRDAIDTARAAALAALAKYGAGVAVPVLRSALADKDWAIRIRASQLLKELDPASANAVAMQMRPAPTTLPMEAYQSARLVTPTVSTQVYIDTDRGTIQVELAVLDAPLTVENFVSLARKGYFNGLSIHRVVPDFVIQDGDPRGDGEGGPGYTIRDELNERPYVRGVMGMALDPWRDTGGSQWFITHSPQPHLDAKYTVFGRVVAGMEVVDQIQQGDVVRRVRVWDGETMTSK